MPKKIDEAEFLSADIPRPVSLIILDGWGVAADSEANAIHKANKPFFNGLLERFPAMVLESSGLAVGLKSGQPSDSQIGHLNIGLGRPAVDDPVKSNSFLSEESLSTNNQILAIINHLKKFHGRFHIISRFDEGGVFQSYLNSFINYLINKGGLNSRDILLHLVLGIDKEVGGLLNFLQSEQNKSFTLATLSGVYYAANIYRNWELTNKAYQAMAWGDSKNILSFNDLQEVLMSNTEDRSRFLPSILKNNIDIKFLDNDVILFFDNQPSFFWQLASVYCHSPIKKIKTRKVANSLVVSLVRLDDYLPIEVIYDKPAYHDSLGEIISRHNLKQCRLTTADRFAHLTYYFNGLIKYPFNQEDDFIFNSTIDKRGILDLSDLANKYYSLVSSNQYDFIAVNLPSLELSAHLGDFPNAIKAVEDIDFYLSKMVKLTIEKDGVVLLVGDHGNGEEMYDLKTGQPLLGHNLNNTFCILVANKFEGIAKGSQVINKDLSLASPVGSLADIAPTILKLMSLPISPLMSGKPLI